MNKKAIRSSDHEISPFLFLFYYTTSHLGYAFLLLLLLLVYEYTYNTMQTLGRWILPRSWDPGRNSLCRGKGTARNTNSLESETLMLDWPRFFDAARSGTTSICPLIDSRYYHFSSGGWIEDRIVERLRTFERNMGACSIPSIWQKFQRSIIECHSWISNDVTD